MSEIIINEKAKTIMESFAEIEPSIVIREDFLFTRNDSIMGMYELPKGEVVTEEVFALDNSKEFLTIDGMLDEETKKITMENGAIVFKDADERIRYATGHMEVMPAFNKKGLELYDESSDVLCKFALNEANLKRLNKLASTLKTTDVYLIGDGENVSIELLNTTTDNTSRVKLEGMNKSGKDFVVQLSDGKAIPFYKVIYDGIYEVEVRIGKVKSSDVLLVKFDSISINSDETGKLFYFTTKAVKGDM